MTTVAVPPAEHADGSTVQMSSAAWTCAIEAAVLSWTWHDMMLPASSFGSGCIVVRRACLVGFVNRAQNIHTATAAAATGRRHFHKDSVC